MTGAATSLEELTREAEAEAARLDGELGEIELLLQQVRTEASRHVQKRTQAAERLSAAESRPQPVPAELKEATAQLLTVTRRASLMEAQVDILEGKQKALARFRDRVHELASALAGLPGSAGTAGPDVQQAGAGDLESSRAILEAQEDLRREIARQMHDGPAQSLTNIALQAQIVQRLVDRDPARASSEVAQLVAMVEQTLDATKTFIFDVRPMVLDDLGLVPTLRRAARERGRKAQVPIDFDSVGADRRIGNDLESGLFRIIDDAIGGYLSTRPAQVEIRLDWTDESLEARVRGLHSDEAPPPEPSPAGPSSGERRERGRGRGRGEEMPAALAQMIEEQQAGEAAASAAAASALAQARALPTHVWQQIQQRARTVGVSVELDEAGQRLVAVAQLA